jgi:hypothetical protein
MKQEKTDDEVAYDEADEVDDACYVEAWDCL